MVVACDNHSRTALWAAAIIAALAAAPSRAGALSAAYLYPLATTTGPATSSASRLAYDRFHHELYVVDAGVVRVFNAAGMEIYAWPEDGALGAIWGVAPLEDGDVLALRYAGDRAGVVRCDFRGTPVEPLALRGLDEAFAAGFRPSLIAHAAGKVYLVDPNEKRLLVADLADGSARAVDLGQVLPIEERNRGDALDGFSVDARGTMYLVMASAFKVFVVPPDGGEVRAFGTSGSAPGKFGIVKGVAADPDGNVYVSDRLKGVVMVFDKDFRFLGEFGGNAHRPGGLYAPYDIVAAEGRIFVSQQARRGVAVFKVSHQG